MKIERDTKFDFDDVLIKPNRSTLNSRSKVVLERTFKFYYSPITLQCIPIMCSNLASVAGLEMAKTLQKYKIITCLHKYINYDEIKQEKNNINFDFIWFTIGQSDDELKKLREFCTYNDIYPNINVDIANGHIDSFVKFCAKVRGEFPCQIIMAGNVTAPECTQELIIHGGVDIVKVGTGPGRFCRTRLVTGIGYPQLSAIIDNGSVAHGLKNGDKKIGLICGDGGCKEIGDICKGLAANSDFMMLGSLFAGHIQCCGDWYINNQLGKQAIVGDKNEYMFDSLYLKCYGMSSKTAQYIFKKEKEYRTSEGEESVFIKNKGDVSLFVQDIFGGLRSCCSYVGADNLKDLSKCTTFLLCNKQK